MSALKFKKILGYLWASPITLLGLLYVSLFHAMKWYTWSGVEGDALVWEVNQTECPQWLLSYWKKWAGHAIGNVIVLNEENIDPERTLIHEQRHVEQVMRLGIFQPIVYGISMLAIRIGCPGTSHYHYNPFEVDARRHAGQKIDVS
jgi:hypothetical protein